MTRFADLAMGRQNSIIRDHAAVQVLFRELDHPVQKIYFNLRRASADDRLRLRKQLSR